MSDGVISAALRALGAGATRRTGLAGALGVLIGGEAAAAAAAGSRGAARKGRSGRDVGSDPAARPGGAGPCGDGSGRDNACTKDKECCTGVCGTSKSGMGRCRCLRKGETCKAKQTCCGKLTCVDGLCQGSAPAPTGPWTNVATFGSEGTGASQFKNPYGVALSPDGLTAWVADTNNSRVSVWTRASASSTTWTNQTTFGTPGLGGGSFVAPPGIAVTPDTLSVLVADYYASTVWWWGRPSASSTSWVYVQQVAGAPIGLASGVSVTGDGLCALVSSIPVGVAMSCRASLTAPFDSPPTSAFATSVGFTPSDVSSPYGVTASSDNLTALIADTINNRISVWTRSTATATDWSNQTTFGSLGYGASQFSEPTGVAMSTNMLTAWVADRGNSRISIWTRPTSSSASWTPQGVFGSMGGGVGQLASPSGLAVSGDGNTVLVADTNNSRISMWVRS